MKIIAIDEQNLSDHIEDLVELNDEFLEKIHSHPKRTHSEKVAIIEKMVSQEFPTILLKVEDEAKKPAGISYYNFGTGYSCGGAYLWLNCVYIRELYQKRGYGTKLIKYIEDDALEKDVTLFICNRSPSNEASSKLFSRMGFKQTEGIVMTKEYKKANQSLEVTQLADASSAPQLKRWVKNLGCGKCLGHKRYTKKNPSFWRRRK